MTEKEAPTTAQATSITKETDPPTTPPRDEVPTDANENSGNNKEDVNERASTPVRKNTGDSLSTPLREATELLPPPSGISTPIRSRPGTPAKEESPILITPIPSRLDLELASSSEETEKPYPKWSDVLKSPSDGAKFSPSKPLNKPGSLHGLGLMVATDRAKKLSQTGRRCAMLLSDVAGLEDTFAQSLLKASLQASNVSSSPIAKMAVGVSRSRISFAKQLQGLAIMVRGSVARPLHSTMASLGDTAPSIYQRYAATRVNCANARNAALRMRVKYVKAVKEAETAIRELRQSKATGNDPTSTPAETEANAMDSATAQSPWEIKLRKYGVNNGVSVDHLIGLLKEVQALEAEYKKLVKEENHAVLQAQAMEVMALEAVQKLEEERLQFFVESLNRLLTAEKGALDNMILSADQDHSEDMTIAETSKEKKPTDFFTKILKIDSNDEEGIGLMEASTLGLPEDVGNLRDEVRSCIASRASRGQVAKGLSMLLEEIASAATALASGIEARIGQEGYGDGKVKSKSADPLSAVMRRSEGPSVGKHWDAIIATIADTAASARQLAYDLRVIRQEKLDAFVLRVERDCKTATDGDDNRWKNLCETARNESKAQLRYQEATSNFEKARDRVKSVEEISSSEHSEGGKGTRMNSGVSRALGNVFSILPDGDRAMQKMLSDDARLQVAKTTLKDADKKESKEKYALDAAIAAKNQSLKSYKAKADNIIFTFKKEDEAGWTDIDETMQKLLTSLNGFRSHRYNSIVKATEGGASQADQLKDITEWTARATTHIGRKVEKTDEQQSTATTAVGLGFALKVELEESTTVYKLLFLDGNEGEDSEPSESAAPAETDQPSPKVVEESAVEISGLLDSPADHFQIASLKKRLSSAEIEELSIPCDAPSDGGDAKVDKEESTKKGEVGQSSSSDAAENSLFVSHFWQDRDEGEEPPTIIESFSCAYWPKDGEGQLSPLLHGRLFLTSNTMFFVGWGQYKIILDLADVISVTKEKNMMGTIDNSLRVTYEKDGVESSYFFGSFAFRDEALQLLQRLSAVARSLREINGPPKAAKAATESSLPPVPHDQVLKKMEIVLSKKIKNVSIERFYELVWSEGNGTDAKPFYGPWLEKMGSHKVKVTDWTVAENGADHFVNKWCGEKYSRRRQVSFEFTRTTHLYIGPPIAGVKQTHYCFVDGNDKCVLAMTVEMEGIPYADCFAVEVRWVARRVGANDIHVEVGVFVDFKKSTMFAKKIRAGTLEETKPVHHKLFDSAKAICMAEGGEAAAVAAEEEEEAEEAKPEKQAETANAPLAILSSVKDIVVDNKNIVVAVIAAIVLLRFATWFFGRGATTVSADETALLHERIDELQVEMKEMRKTLDAILRVLKEKN